MKVLGHVEVDIDIEHAAQVFANSGTSDQARFFQLVMQAFDYKDGYSTIGIYLKADDRKLGRSLVEQIMKGINH